MQTKANLWVLCNEPTIETQPMHQGTNKTDLLLFVHTKSNLESSKGLTFELESAWKSGLADECERIMHLQPDVVVYHEQAILMLISSNGDLDGF